MEGLSNHDLIRELRDWAEVEGPGSLAHILTVASDRIEQLDERIGIIGDRYDVEECEFNDRLQEIGVREP